MRNKNIHKGLAHISTFFFEISSYWMKQFLVLIGCLFVSHFCFSQNLDSKDENLLQTLYDLEIGSDIKLLNNYFSELDLNVETMRPDQYRIMFHKEFAGMDSVRHEFSYLNNQLISYGISKGGLDKAASEELQNAIVTFLENYADVKMNVNEETLMDGHGPQLTKSYFLELETTHFGVSYSETYDGFLFSLGKQALHSSPIIVQHRDKENSNTAKHHRPFVAPKGIVQDLWHSLTASPTSLNRNSFTLPVYNKQDSQAEEGNRGTAAKGVLVACGAGGRRLNAGDVDCVAEGRLASGAENDEQAGHIGSVSGIGVGSILAGSAASIPKVPVPGNRVVACAGGISVPKEGNP